MSKIKKKSPCGRPMKIDFEISKFEKSIKLFIFSPINHFSIIDNRFFEARDLIDKSFSLIEKKTMSNSVGVVLTASNLTA